MSCFDIQSIRDQFPALSLNIGKYPLTYLDSGASAQKPQCVIDRIAEAYAYEYANVHRGLHHLSNLATDNYEAARKTVQNFMNAKKEEEIIFTKSATEALNLVAQTLLLPDIKAGDEIIISEMEHHSNIVPWHFLRERYGAVLKWIPVLDDGTLDMEGYKALLSKRTKLVAVTHMSNVLGTINPIKDITTLAKEHGAYVVIDGSQGIVHNKVDVQEIGCDFYAFTGHKLYGPSGIGVLYGRHELLNSMRPFLGGGEMIASVSKEDISYAESPERFEAGTPPIVQAIGLARAIEFVNEIGHEAIQAHENTLLKAVSEGVHGMNNVRIIGEAKGKGAILTFAVKDVHAHDISTLLNNYGVAVRAGTHCAEPLMTRFGETSSCRASFALYNDLGDVNRFVEALEKSIRFFS